MPLNKTFAIGDRVVVRANKHWEDSACGQHYMAGTVKSFGGDKRYLRVALDNGRMNTFFTDHLMHLETALALGVRVPGFEPLSPTLSRGTNVDAVEEAAYRKKRDANLREVFAPPSSVGVTHVRNTSSPFVTPGEYFLPPGTVTHSVGENGELKIKIDYSKALRRPVVGDSVEVLRGGAWFPAKVTSTKLGMVLFAKENSDLHLPLCLLFADQGKTWRFVD